MSQPFDKDMKRVNPLYKRDVSVWDAALDRIRWLFDEFDNRVRVSFSGGKDSTVIMELALIVARERDALPLEVYWIDQECEWQGTVDYCRATADRPEVDFHWFQVPLQLLNSANLTPDGKVTESWLDFWCDPEPDCGFIHPRQPDAITVNPYNTTRFKEFAEFHDGAYGGATLTGIRIEESPARRLTMIKNPTYKHITWGKRTPQPDSFQFSPIWDWEWRDVWHAIAENGWAYNGIYDGMFRHGVAVRDMRVSSIIHEAAVSNLYLLHELEPATWDRVVARLPGVSATHHLTRQEMFSAPKTLPPGFTDWREFRDYLIEHLVPDHLREGIIAACASADNLTVDTPYDSDDWVRAQITGVLTGYDTKIRNLIASNGRAPRAWLKANRPERFRGGSKLQETTSVSASDE